MGKNLKALAFFAVSLFAISGFQHVARAGELPETLDRWYDALRQDDRTAIGELLAEDATVELRDLGIVQTRQEFIDSLDQWAEANDGAEILARPEAGAEGMVAVEVCYRFASNETLIRESFDLIDGRIHRSVQEEIAGGCGDF